MLEDGVNVLNKYVALASTVSGAEAASLCLAATGDPQLHVFGELLDAPSISALASTEHQSSLDLLRLFAYDTYAEYSVGKSRFPVLSEQHIRKLRRLSVVSLANQSNMITYGQLRKCLGVTSVREVEDAVLDAVYAGLIRVRLDQRASVVEVISAVGRDVDSQSGVRDMLTLLSNWANSAESIVREIDQNIAVMKHETAAAARERHFVQQTSALLQADYRSTSFDGGPSRSRDRGPHGSFRDSGPGSSRDRPPRKQGPSTSHGAGSSVDGWRLPSGRSIRSRFEM